MLKKIRTLNLWAASLALIACVVAGSRAEADTTYSYFTWPINPLTPRRQTAICTYRCTWWR